MPCRKKLQALNSSAMKAASWLTNIWKLQQYVSASLLSRPLPNLHPLRWLVASGDPTDWVCVKAKSLTKSLWHEKIRKIKVLKSFCVRGREGMTWGRKAASGRNERIKQKTFLIHVKDSLKTTKFNFQVFFHFWLIPVNKTKHSNIA